MRRRNRAFYRVILRRLSLGELVVLYERTLTEFEPLLPFIAEELDRRLTGGVTEAV